MMDMRSKIMTGNTSNAEEDIRLANAIKKEDQEALALLYDKYAPALMGVVSRIVHIKVIAEEVLQATFLHVWNQIDTFYHANISLLLWMTNIARKLAFEKVKSAQLKNTPDNNNVYSGTIDKNDHKNIFEMVYFKGFNCIEAAALLNIPVAELRKSIRLAIKNMNGVQAL